MTVYAIGDIHGQLELLLRAHALIEADRRAHGLDGAPVVHLGDLVDRGPDSRGVVQHLIDGVARGAPWIVLKGNHDRLFARFLADPAWQDPALRPDLDWLQPPLGGRRTLLSYGVESAAEGSPAEVHAEAVARVPAEHLAFIEALPLWHRTAEALFVHAGIRPGVPLEAQAEDDLVWIRGPFLMEPDDHGFLVVHGHTTIEAPTHYGNRLNLDSGAAYGGPLSAVAVEGRSAWLLTEAGRQPLLPVTAA
ncbi:MAG: metallophosphoesterase [Rhodobacteraceae bacterium]|nr:metallophosphoesterase [Paracoccaceae bacterium]